jgi:hypothetical protein
MTRISRSTLPAAAILLLLGGAAGHERSGPWLVLDPGRPQRNIDVDPRELSLPDGQASEGSG